MADLVAILSTPLGANDAGASTVRDYLIALLRQVWTEKECFSGKRPFGNSSWQYEVYVPLMKAGLIEGKLDEDGYVEEMDTDKADELILAAIDRLM